MRIGITGHQNFENEAWVSCNLDQQLDKLEPTHGYSSLAIGADQLFARHLARRAIPYTVIVPSERYEETFTSDESKRVYQELLGEASNVIMLSNSKPSEHAFYDAGLRVVDSSEVVLAIWNGRPAKGLGGTADIVHYAKENHKTVIHINPDTKDVTIYGKE
jgi:hypothetical protein